MCLECDYPPKKPRSLPELETNDRSKGLALSIEITLAASGARTILHAYSAPTRCIVTGIVMALVLAMSSSTAAFQIGAVRWDHFDTIEEASAQAKWFVENGPTQDGCTIQHVPHPAPTPQGPPCCFGVDTSVRTEHGRWQLANPQGQICQNNFADYERIEWTCPPGTYGDTDGELNGAGYGCVATPPGCPIGKYYDETLGRCLSGRNFGAPLCDQARRKI